MKPIQQSFFRLVLYVVRVYKLITPQSTFLYVIEQLNGNLYCIKTINPKYRTIRKDFFLSCGVHIICSFIYQGTGRGLQACFSLCELSFRRLLS